MAKRSVESQGELAARNTATTKTKLESLVSLQIFLYSLSLSSLVFSHSHLYSAFSFPLPFFTPRLPLISFVSIHLFLFLSLILHILPSFSSFISLPLSSFPLFLSLLSLHLSLLPLLSDLPLVIAESFC